MAADEIHELWEAIRGLRERVGNLPARWPRRISPGPQFPRNMAFFEYDSSSDPQTFTAPGDNLLVWLVAGGQPGNDGGSGFDLNLTDESIRFGGIGGRGGDAGNVRFSLLDVPSGWTLEIHLGQGSAVQSTAKSNIVFLDSNGDTQVTGFDTNGGPRFLGGDDSDSIILGDMISRPGRGAHGTYGGPKLGSTLRPGRGGKGGDSIFAAGGATVPIGGLDGQWGSGGAGGDGSGEADVSPGEGGAGGDGCCLIMW